VLKRAWCAALTVSGLVVAPARAAGDDSEIRKLVNDVRAGWNTLDPDKAPPSYARDADLVFFDLAPLKFTGWRQFKERVLATIFNNMTAGKVTWEEWDGRWLIAHERTSAPLPV
jgi:hypothetical protein